MSTIITHRQFPNYHKYEMELAGRPLTLEVGKLAELANAAVMVGYGDTRVLVCATASARPRDGIDFFPLSVDFEEKLYSVGRIPGSFNRREGRPGEKGILIAGVDYNAYSSMAKGEPLKIYYPASGTVVNPRPAMILKTAPNMDNAKAFVVFLLSEDAQKLVADAYLLPGRSDVQCENRTNLSDIPQIPTDWTKMMGVASDTAAKLNSLCK